MECAELSVGWGGAFAKARMVYGLAGVNAFALTAIVSCDCCTRFFSFTGLAGACRPQLILFQFCIESRKEQLRRALCSSCFLAIVPMVVNYQQT